MESIAAMANQYEPPKAKSITELDKISVNAQIDEKTVGEGEKEFTYKFIRIGKEEYRVPIAVLKQLKEHLKANPKLEFFKVSKTGEGMKTAYTVIPLMG